MDNFAKLEGKARFWKLSFFILLGIVVAVLAKQYHDQLSEIRRWQKAQDTFGSFPR